MRRIVSIALAMAMMMPALASVAEASIGTWLTPAPGQTVPSGKVEVAVGFNTGSDSTVSKLELFVDGKFQVRRVLNDPASRGVCSFVWDTADASLGSHDLLVKIYSGSKVVASVSGTGTVGQGGSYGGIDTQPPVVYFSNIRAGDVLKGKKIIKISAYDDSAKPPLVSLLVDDALKLLKNTPPYNYELDTTTYANGSHQLKTYAYDGAGNKSDPTVVKVSFSNGTIRPVVAALSVGHSSGAVPLEAQVEVPDLVAVPSSGPTLKMHSAGRTSQSESETGVSHPMRVARPAEPQIKHTAVAHSVKKTSAAKSSEPVNVASALQRIDVLLSPAASARIQSHLVKPDAIGAPQPSKAQPVLEARNFALHSTDLSHAVGTAVAAPLEEISQPVASNAKNVRVSMLPKIRGAGFNGPDSTGIACPPLPARSTKAKIEKTTVPLSGKIKARDLFEKLGGLLFWDPSTHTVTAYVTDLKIEMQIGSTEILVNGAKLQVNDAPMVIKGRTVIDVRLYHQARAFLHSRHSA